MPISTYDFIAMLCQTPPAAIALLVGTDEFKRLSAHIKRAKPPAAYIPKTSDCNKKGKKHD
ncbi:hypothetical protein [Paludibacterium sp.]|uniref:hypothetical protein n=1 Tax=Paludibacterium sp. TaxID=1917523 RepID=UPI0025F40620|nr:hypothetical protein [Paludibacterium sp.]MBV8649620.1 hypothetical protein [Paludibacterium sp.]